MTDTTDYILIEDEAALARFIEENKAVEWMGFDTEFIGEKRYYTLLCLIQIATTNGNYLIDTIKLRNIDSFLEMVENPAILKITHAGENDYRILNTQYNVIPKNLFDTQIGAGFIGYRYPLSFGKLLDKEINVRISKGYMVTDWKARPLKPKQIKYALNDVIFLKELYESIKTEQEKLGRSGWMAQEMTIWESEEYYSDNVHKEALESRLMQQLPLREQVFLLRLYAWRLEEAKKRNYSKEMILPKKTLGIIVQNINNGKMALKDNRIISNKVIERHWHVFNDLYQAKIEEEEKAVLENIPEKTELSPSEELSSELLYLLMKKMCMDSDVASELLTSKNALKQLRFQANFEHHRLLNGWRGEFLGQDLIQWLTSEGDLTMKIGDGRCVISQVNT